MNAIILSAQFWPSFREEKITLPSQLQSCLDAYTQQYEMLKGNRTLVWKPHLGQLVVPCVEEVGGGWRGGGEVGDGGRGGRGLSFFTH